MAHRRLAIAPGQPFHIPENIVSSTISGSWITFGDAAPTRAIRVQGVYWSCTHVGSQLKIRDTLPTGKVGGVWYEVESISIDPPAIDMFNTYLTLFSPFQYYQSGSSGDQLVIYGEYM